MFYLFLCGRSSAEPPNFFVDYDANNVNEPNKRREEEKNYGDYDAKYVRSIYALDKAVNSPNDIKRGDAEKELNYPRQVIHCGYKCFHVKPPCKKNSENTFFYII